MNDDPKKYIILENILQKVNQKYIALPDDEVKRNNKLLLIIDNIVQQMRGKNQLFDKLYQNKFYGGSYYDNLKVGNPSEYDLDCLLSLPKAAQPTVEVSDKPGYVHITLSMEALRKKVDEAPKYAGLEKLLDGNRLSTKKVKSWMESLTSMVLSKTSSTIKINIDDVQYHVKAKICKSGPAFTIKLEGEFDGKSFNIDVDLVPCFTFFADQWPKEGYRENTSKSRNTFFVVPKSPSDNDIHYWRLSFQEQERELIGGSKAMKPTIRLIKKIRDRDKHNIASYFIKTVFLWELNKVGKDFWDKPMSYVFMIMLRKYSEYIASKNIPYYWNEKYNLIENLQSETISCISNRLKNIADEVERNFSTSPYSIIQYFLSASEVDLEAFKLEVPLGKKQLRQLGLRNSSQDNFVMTEALVIPPLASTQSSVASSFEEISKDMLNDSPVSPTLEVLSKLETLCLEISSQQKQMSGLIESVLTRVENCENQIKQLRENTKTTRDRDTDLSELVKMVGMLNKKIDTLTKKPVPEDYLNLLLDRDDTLKRTAHFLPE